MAQDGQDEDDWLGHSKTGPSPLVIVSMAAAKVTLQLLAAIMILVAGVILWSRYEGQRFVFKEGDTATLILIGVLAVLCAVLARYIGREMNRS